jgi:hypothetical protein
MNDVTAEDAVQAMRSWVEHAVIGLNLCPFAKAVQVKTLLRHVCSEARDTQALLADLRVELQRLVDTPIETLETTLLVHPWVLQDFLDYNDFLDDADALLAGMGLDGTLQIASFHPQYQFAGTRSDDVENATNQSPYPALHLLREASIERAVAAYPEPEAIYETNMATLRGLGAAGWAALQARCLRQAQRGDSDRSD